MIDKRPLWTIADICDATNGQTHHGRADTAITGVSIDSRDIKTGDLFVALPGTVSDGHKFLAAAHAAGASAALVTAINHQLDLPQICVTDCLNALRQLAVAGRARFRGIQFGITGSVGKTGSKDMLRHALSQFGRCHASQRSYNNHIGVPISLASLPQQVDYAVQEMGMNAAGEIADLTRLTRPNIAFVTRIADSHSAFFDSTADIATAKAEGKRWKLIGRCSNDGEQIKASVAPISLPLENALANVGGATNAITYQTDLIGPVTLVGAGAGGSETAAGVLADILTMASYAKVMQK